MNRTPNRLAAVLLALALLLAASGCSDDGGSDAGSDGGAATTEAPAGTDEAATDEAATDEGGDEGGDEAEAGTCIEDSNELSGSSTVVWDDGEVSPELTMTFGEDGSLSPSSLTVPVGERFAVDHGPGTDLRAVKIGCAGAQTLPAGVTAGFVIDAPGTYVIIDEAADDYAGAEVGSVTVE